MPAWTGFAKASELKVSVDLSADAHYIFDKKGIRNLRRSGCSLTVKGAPLRLSSIRTVLRFAGRLYDRRLRASTGHPLLQPARPFHTTTELPIGRVMCNGLLMGHAVAFALLLHDPGAARKDRGVQ